MIRHRARVDDAREVAAPDPSSAYGDGCAAFYDALYPAPPRAMLDAIVALAAGDVVLDAGSGTGRVLLALAARGVAAEGIEASPRMIAAMRAKAGGDALVVHPGDFATIVLPARFSLVTCLVDTISLLPDREAQRRAIARFARALAPGGALLIETTVDHASIRSSRLRHDVVVTTSTGAHRYRVDTLPLDLATLDALARDAGLAVAARWRDWRRRPWDGEAGTVISLFRRSS